MTDCLFCAIATGDIPAEVVARTENVIAFRDIAPAAPVHVLVIPREHYATAAELAEVNPLVAAELFVVAGQVADQEGIATSGYRLESNVGDDAGQTVNHVHLHVLGGRDLGALVGSAGVE
ncbi:histidine triad nucleotide-binding protein [Ornithinimicrobium sp. Arc0846-15]|nr:histidine triad nucleotide-binding protein [Ornithinimicrobium laminariae]